MKIAMIGFGIILFTTLNSFGQTLDSATVLQDTIAESNTINETLNEKYVAKLKSLNLDSLSEREFQYLMHIEKMYQDSVLSAQTKALAVSEKPAGLYKATTVISIIFSAISATFLTMSFVHSIND